MIDRRSSFGAAIALFVSPMPALAVNGYSFTDVSKSRAGYDRAELAPVRACTSLIELSSAGIAIQTAAEIAAKGKIPAYCLVRGLISPEIKFEVRLPMKWNGRFYMHGTGGYSGQPLETFYAEYRDEAVRHGFATATTNSGHDAASEPGATFAYRNDQKKIDWAYRAVHLTAQTARHLIGRFYDRAESFSYFDGCSNGGRQGLISTQRFPADFDGVVAGAPLFNFTETSISYLWTARALRETPIPASKMPLIAAAVMRRCDAGDGLKDGLIADPRTCDYDPRRDLPHCLATQDTTCFTDAELVTLARIRAGPPSGGRPYVHGVLPGAEPEGVIYLSPNDVRTGWFEWVSDPRGPMYYQAGLGEQFMKYMAFAKQDPDATAASFNFGKDPARMSATRALVDATNPDLTAFRRRGGKLLLYHGLADLGTNPLITIDYFDRATKANGGQKSRDFMRMFLVPGMFHCFGGYGPDRFDAMTALIDWVELGRAPDAILAGKTERRDGGKLLRTRPICAYPRTARYKGTGSIDDAASFTCAAPQARSSGG